MSDCRRGTGPNCNCSEELVAMLVSKLSATELGKLDRAHAAVVHDSIAEAYEQKASQVTAPHVAVNGC